MLTKLTIDNYALIDKTVIDFREGFTVITGETGSGKSIMLDALSLLTGTRADTKAIGNKERKMVVEAIFSKPDETIKKICEENGIETDENEVILRREISPAGKSRGFVNDTPVNLGVLGAVASHLLDIHSQHSNSLLNRKEAQLEIIDSFGDAGKEVEEYKEVFKKYLALRNKIKQIRETIAQGKENRDFIMFRLEQLDKLKPKKGELKDLEREAEILGDADSIKSGLKTAVSLLGGGNSALKSIQNALSVVENIDFKLLDPHSNDNPAERLNSLKIELRDISDTLEAQAEKIDSDPVKLEKVTERIDALYEAIKRYKVKDEDELVDLHEHLKRDLAAITGEDTDLPALEAELKILAKELKEKAETLSEKRKDSAGTFASTVIEKIRPLGLPNVNFEVEIQKGKMSHEGQDTVTFLCSFNKNHPLQPVSEIASGGEISRMMLGIKSVMAQKMQMPTIIFDEIDTGVSGEIAHKMGRMMKEMSTGLQVLAVTHLPQVAAGGDSHLKVYKADDKDKTVSMIRSLDRNERVTEIAGMLSGTTIEEAALENARILLNTD